MANQTVQFTDASAGTPTSWSWSFGDGGTSSIQHPSHTYAAAGTFTVSLTAGNASGSTTATRSVAVAPATPTTPASFGIVLGRPSDGSAVYRQTLLNELADRPDLMVDLGDTAMVDTCAVDGSTLCATPPPSTSAGVWARNALMRSYFDVACHSVPLFMALGNHDGEAGWIGDAAADNLAGWSLRTRKTFYPNPEPDAVYAGNTQQVAGIGYRQNYYAFEWGGRNLDGTWAFDKQRPGRPAPIH
jgi:hypothetical protein